MLPPLEHIEKDAALSCSVLTELRDYWLKLCGDRPMPARQEIDPVEIPRLLRHLALTDVYDDPKNQSGLPWKFRYRLIGTMIVSIAGRDNTGKWLDEELYGKNLDRMLWAYRECARASSPLAVREAVLFATREWVVVEVIMLPLGNENQGLETILVGLDAIDDSVEKPNEGTSFVLNWRL